ncbi:MAG: small multi-drug export protein [Candidatus Aenigmatarchaeota archaeon]
MEKTLYVVLANLIPTVEQVGAIPLGLALGLDPITVFSISIAVNCCLFFPVFFGLTFFYEIFLSKIGIFRKYLEKIRSKGKPYVEKYGVIGIAFLMFLPSPFSGTYTASTLAWLLNLDWKKSLLAIFIGSFIGGLIILLSIFGIFNLLKAFLGL